MTIKIKKFITSLILLALLFGLSWLFFPTKNLATVNRSTLDLAISKTPSTYLIQQGDSLTYTIIYTNVGSSLATQVIITDIIPPDIVGPMSGSTYLPPNFNSSGAAITATGSVNFSWQVQNLQPGQGGIITVSGIVNTVNPFITNTATITATGVDINPTNNSDSAIVQNTCTIIAQPLQIVFVLDRSGSTSDNQVYTQSIIALHNAVDAMLPTDEAAIISFSSDVTTHTLGFTSNHSILHAAIDSIPNPDGYTYMADALQESQNVLTTYGKPNFLQTVVLLSDGKPTDGSGDPIPIATALKDSGVVLISIGIGSGVDEQLMIEIASPGQAYFAETADQLDEIFSTWNQTIRCAIDVALSKTVNQPIANLGDILTFTLTFTNYSSSVAHNVVITDIMPANINPIGWGSSILITPTGNLSYAWQVGSLSPGAGGSVWIVGELIQLGLITNTATITSTTPDALTDNNSDTATVLSPPPPSQADLAISKVVNRSNAQLGDIIFFTLVFTNNGPDFASNVVITDIIPPEIINLTWNSNLPLTRTNNVTYSWQVGNLAPGTGGTILIGGQLNGVGAITNTAIITGATQDVFEDNNSDSVVIDVPIIPTYSDLSIEKTTNQTVAHPSDIVTFTLSFANNGPDIAHNVIITDVIPPQFAIYSWSSTMLITPTGNVSYTWLVGSLMAGQSEVITVVGELLQTGLVSNSAFITSTTFDTNLSNNFSWVTVDTVPRPPQADLVINKTVNHEMAQPGDALIFHLDFSNNGPGTAYNVLISDVLPIEITNTVWVSTHSVTPTGNLNYVWQVGNLAPGEEGSIIIIGELGETNLVTNTSIISSTTVDTVPSNNIDSATVAVMYTLNISITGQGSVRSLPGITMCQDNCTTSYLANRNVTLAAMPAEGWGVRSWQGDLTSTNSIEVLTMDSNKNVICEFCLIEKPLEGVLVFDSSGSMEFEITDAKTAGKGFVDYLDLLSHLDRRLAVISFDYYSYLLQGLTNNPQDLHNAIDNIYAYGGTYIIPAIEMAHEQLLNSQVEDRFVVLLSDGDPYEYEIDVLNAAQELKDDGIRIITIGLGYSVNEDIMKGIATSEDLYFWVADPNNLFDVYQHIAGLIDCRESAVKLNISKSVKPAVARFGNIITYTIKYSNNIPGLNVTGVVITDNMPPEIVSAISGTGQTPFNWSNSGALITPTNSSHLAWQVQPLAFGEGGIITISGVLSHTASAVIINTATITASGLPAQTDWAKFTSQNANTVFIPLVIKTYYYSWP